MLAAVLHDFDVLRLEDVPKPVPSGTGEVIVAIKSCGFCATDYKAIKGIRRNVTFPFICGHEPSGIVAEVGPGVTRFKPGDEVIVQPSGFCGLCKHCREGNSHYCAHAFTTGGDGPMDVWPGAFAEYMKTLEVCLFPKPPTISFDAAALTEPLSGAWKGVVHYSQLQVGEDAVVIGVGGIGLLCLMVAHAAGAGRLIAVDRSPYALQNALALGATDAIECRSGIPAASAIAASLIADPSVQSGRDAASTDVKQRVYEIIPDGPDLIVEAAGPIDAVRLMVDLRRRGTRWNVFGITTHERFDLDGGLTHFLEGRMDASFGTTPLAMSKAIRLMERGLVDTEKIISHRFPLSKIHDAIAAMASPERNKVIINPGQGVATPCP